MSHSRFSRLALAGGSSLLALSALAQDAEFYSPEQGRLDGVGESDRANWMSEVRFGMFIHWGLYSIPAGVWNGEESSRGRYSEWLRMNFGWPDHTIIPKEEYDGLLSQFNPTGFDAEQIARLADEAGMEYVVITAKHHDGFALWDSEVSDYDLGATPFAASGRDLLGELAAACRERGLKVGFYYSHWQDWEHPMGALPGWLVDTDKAHLLTRTREQFEQYWQEKSLPQVRELIERYHPDMLWFDTWGNAARRDMTPRRRDELIELVRGLAPDCLINGRIAAHNPAGADFISMGDNQFPSEDSAPTVPWETPGTMNRGWGYHRLETHWRSFDDLLADLLRNAAHGGSLTLNIGPMGDGRIQPPEIRRLRQFAAWMEINERALQPTRRSLFREEDHLPESIVSTTSPDEAAPSFYLHLLEPQGARKLSLPQPLALPAGPPEEFRAQVLETRELLPVTRELQEGRDTLQLTLPAHLNGIDHPAIQIGPASSIPAVYQDDQPVEPVRPGRFLPGV